MNSTLPETAGYHSSSGMSELDNLSDSDWLDIASGNDSEDNDNDSLSDESEVEGEPLSLPLSRRSSSASIASSRGGVDAWEGFVDPIHGEGAGPSATGMYPLPQPVAESTEQTPLELIPDIVTDQDVAEDELVKEALNQSLISTLNASRTSATNSTSSHTSSNQASVRDLRLSFPDPLSSPRSELERSYEQVSVDNDQVPSTDGASDVDRPADLDYNHGSEPLAPAHHEVPTKPDFQIHLYGSSTKHKWTVVQDFLQKVADGAGQFLINTLDPTPEKKVVRTAVLGKVNAESKPLFNIVRIYDRTHDANTPDVEVNNPIDTPSLAIIFLPTNRLPVMGTHTAYLAVIANDYISDVIYNNERAVRDAAEDDLELLNLPGPQVLSLKTPAKSVVINHQDIKYLNARQAYRALESIICDDVDSPTDAPHKSQLAPANAAKVIAVVSVILSIAFNASSFGTPSPTPTVNLTVPNNNWTSIVSVPNRSTAISVQNTVRGKTQIAVSSARDAAVSIYNPGTTALAITPSPDTKALSPSTPPVSPVARRQEPRAAPSDQEAKKEQASLTSAPASEDSSTSSFPNIAPQAESSSTEKSDRSESTNTALGMNFVNSLSEALGVTTSSIVKAVNEDGAELMESLDDIMTVIKSQTDDLIRQSKGKARAIQDHVQAVGEAFQYRNDRAKTRAKQLKRRGEEFLSTASEHFRDRTILARERARKVREVVEDAEVWDYYHMARQDWADRLQKERRSRRSCFKKRRARGRRHDSYTDSYYDCTT